jgi:hypothetical protein
MRLLTGISSPTWARASLHQVWKLREHTAAFVAPPRMGLVQAATQFGRLEHRHGLLALLVTVTFHNDGAQHIWLRSLAVKYGVPGITRCRSWGIGSTCGTPTAAMTSRSRGPRV